jgi:sulfite reductase alpha subunit-like flavoprotein
MKQRSAIVLYGTETGAAQDVAEELGRMVERLRFASHVTDLDSIEPV